jgi:hypothetical protein
MVLAGLYTSYKKSNNVNFDKLQSAIESIKPVTVEKVGDQYMMYDAITQSYICHAASIEELWAEASRRYPQLKLYDVNEITRED